MLKETGRVQPFILSMPLADTVSCPLRAQFVFDRMRLCQRPPVKPDYDFIKILPQEGSLSYDSAGLE